MIATLNPTIHAKREAIGIVPIMPKQYCSLRKGVFYGVIDSTTFSPSQPGSTLFLSPSLVVKTGPSSATTRNPNGVATRLPQVVYQLDDMGLCEIFFLSPNTLTCGSLSRSAWQFSRFSLTDRLISGTTRTAHFETCKQEWSICYRRHRDTLLRVRLGAQKFELAIVTGGRSGGSSMRY